MASNWAVGSFVVVSIGTLGVEKSQLGMASLSTQLIPGNFFEEKSQWSISACRSSSILYLAYDGSAPGSLIRRDMSDHLFPKDRIAVFE